MTINLFSLSTINENNGEVPYYLMFIISAIQSLKPEAEKVNE